MVLRTSPVVDERRSAYLVYEPNISPGMCPRSRRHGISCTLGLPDGSGYVRLASADPASSRTLIIVICNIRMIVGRGSGRPAVGEAIAAVGCVQRVAELSHSSGG